jgi:hypothetical protein
MATILKIFRKRAGHLRLRPAAFTLLRNAFAAATASMMTLSCVSKEEMIVPTEYDRLAWVDRYKSCVASKTNQKFDQFTRADVIARQALAQCSHIRNGMLKEYPDRWRESYLKEVDAELYQREIAWISETRKKQ